MGVVLILAIVLSVVIALTLAFASRAFYVYEDPRLQDLIGMLPLANCGQCGNPGCKGMAESILREESRLTSCKPGDQPMRDKIKAYLEATPNEEGEFTKVKM